MHPTEPVPITKVKAVSTVQNTVGKIYQIQRPYIKVHEAYHLGCDDNNIDLVLMALMGIDNVTCACFLML